MDRITTSMADFGQLAKDIEQWMASIDPTALKQQNTVHTKAIATNTKILFKCRKKYQHQKIRLGKHNHLIEELDATTTKHTTTISTLMTKIQDLEKQATRTQALESRISILESLQTDNILKLYPPIWIQLVRRKN